MPKLPSITMGSKSPQDDSCDFARPLIWAPVDDNDSLAVTVRTRKAETRADHPHRVERLRWQPNVDSRL